VNVNIIGYGIDLVDVAEMRRWIDDPRDPLIPRCFVHLATAFTPLKRSKPIIASSAPSRWRS
jgi:hypothetical protein